MGTSQHPLGTVGALMDHKPRYRYYKRCETRDGTASMILREPTVNPLGLEAWEDGCWRSATDLWWQVRQECDYWDISEGEAMTELEGLQERQTKFREQRRRDEEEARRKILEERKAERARRHELDDWTALERAAITLHEMFLSLTAAGFTEDQALTLISKTMVRADGGADARS